MLYTHSTVRSVSAVEQILSCLGSPSQYQKYARDKNRVPYMGRWLIIARIVWFNNIFIALVAPRLRFRSRTYFKCLNV